jgi:ribosomal-protein-alanine N-acetyltransferase
VDLEGGAFTTERLQVRPTTIEDAMFLLELMNSPKYIKFIGDKNIHTSADAEKYIVNKMHLQLKSYGYANNTVVRKLDDQKIGTCGLYRRDGIEGVDLGFAFLPLYEKKGYAFEACHALIVKAFKEYEIEVIKAYTSPGNKSSQILLKRLGFVAEGTMTFPREEEELLVFNLKKSDK